jgi:hypothetical protein
LPPSLFPNLQWLTISTGIILHQLIRAGAPPPDERHITSIFQNICGLEILQYDISIKLDVLTRLHAVQHLVIRYQLSAAPLIRFPKIPPTSNPLAAARLAYPLKTFALDLTSIASHSIVSCIYSVIVTDLSPFPVQLFPHLESILLIYSSKDANSRSHPGFDEGRLQFLLETPECQAVLMKLPIELLESMNS